MDERDDELEWERQEMFRQEEEQDRIGVWIEEGQRADGLRKQLEQVEANLEGVKEDLEVEEDLRKQAEQARDIYRSLVEGKDGEEERKKSEAEWRYCKRVLAKLREGGEAKAAILSTIVELPLVREMRAHRPSDAPEKARNADYLWGWRLLECFRNWKKDFGRDPTAEELHEARRPGRRKKK